MPGSYWPPASGAASSPWLASGPAIHSGVRSFGFGAHGQHEPVVSMASQEMQRGTGQAFIGQGRRAHAEGSHSCCVSASTCPSPPHEWTANERSPAADRPAGAPLLSPRGRPSSEAAFQNSLFDKRIQSCRLTASSCKIYAPRGPDSRGRCCGACGRQAWLPEPPLQPPRLRRCRLQPADACSCACWSLRLQPATRHQVSSCSAL